MTKKILFILLLVSNFSFGQITIDITFGMISTSADATAFSRGPATFTAGKLYLWVTMTTGATNVGTISSTTLTWENVITVGDATRRISVWRCLPTTTATGETVTLGTFGGGTTGYAEVMWVCDNVQLGGNGANAIRQAVSSSATGTDPTITMATLGQRNAVVSFWENDQNPFGGTAEAGWSEIDDTGFDTPTTGFYDMYRINTSDNTPLVTAASSTWIGVAIELRQSGRRLTLID